jgi:hypothetical protein
MMLRIEKYRNEFVNCDGVPSILAALDGRANFQLQYQLIFCLWSVIFPSLINSPINTFIRCLSFDNNIARYIQSLNIIQVLGDILSECSKEKVVRIILHTFRNLLEKINNRDIVRESALQMVQCKTLKTLELMDAKKFDDEDLVGIGLWKAWKMNIILFFRSWKTFNSCRNVCTPRCRI